MTTEEKINSIKFGDNPSIKADMTANEMSYIRDISITKLGHIDLADLMYDSYRLGLAKGFLLAGIKAKDFKKVLAGKEKKK